VWETLAVTLPLTACDVGDGSGEKFGEKLTTLLTIAKTKSVMWRTTWAIQLKRLAKRQLTKIVNR